MRFTTPGENALHKANEYWLRSYGRGRPIPIGKFRQAGDIMQWTPVDLAYADAIYQAAQRHSELSSVATPAAGKPAWSEVPPIAATGGSWRADFNAWKASIAAVAPIDPIVPPQDVFKTIEWQDVGPAFAPGPSNSLTLSAGREEAVRRTWANITGRKNFRPTDRPFSPLPSGVADLLAWAALDVSYPATFTQEMQVLQNLRIFLKREGAPASVLKDIDKDIGEMAMMAHRHEVNGRLA